MVEDALRGELFLAYEVNGVPLPPQHGSTLRVVVPDWYGMASLKWLKEIRALEQPPRASSKRSRITTGNPRRIPARP